jgi:C4-dicarboxylate-specific signal transduction histidine kinase
LRQADKLASLGTLASGMAHEVNNPVQGIMGMAEIILEEQNHEKISEYARDIIAYSKHVGTVVRDFCPIRTTGFT